MSTGTRSILTINTKIIASPQSDRDAIVLHTVTQYIHT